MENPKVPPEAAAPPDRAGLRGTALVHFGPLWDATLEAKRQRGEGAVAVLVCHGMGQQVRYETISSIAQAILDEADAEGGTSSPLQVNLSQGNEGFLARAEVGWTDAGGIHHDVHVYEAYWAPLTEGKVTYWDTVKFLLLAACKGLWYSRPFGPRTFKRWMFGGPRQCRSAARLSSA